MDEINAKNQECITCKTGQGKHTTECLFQHFLSYTGFFSQPENIKSMLFVAYSHSQDTGSGWSGLRGDTQEDVKTVRVSGG